MRHSLLRAGYGPGLVCLLWLAMGVGSPPAPAQEQRMELIEQVTDLFQQLSSERVPQRDEAQAKIIGLGPAALDYIELSDDASTDLRRRVAEIRRELEAQAVAAVSQASQVTLSGRMTVAQALEQITSQTGNRLVLQADAFAEQEIQPDWQQANFWQAVDWLMKEAKLTVDRYGGAPDLLKLAPAAPTPDVEATPPVRPVTFSKIFRIEVTRVDSSVHPGQPQLGQTQITLLIRWEPRLRPISVDLPMSSVKIVDEYGDSAPVANPNAVIYGIVQPQLPELEFALPLQRVDRQVESLQQLRARVDALIPGRIETFRFRKVREQRAGRQIQRAGATVTYGGTRQNENLYMVTLSLSFEEENNALESHQNWVFQNEVYLVDAEGNREEPVGLETVQQDNSKVTLRYLFIEDPDRRTLVYRTPAAIVKLPVDIELKNIPLP